MEQLFEFTALENVETWGFCWGIGTAEEAIAYLDLLNKKIVYPNSPGKIVWNFKIIENDPSEEYEMFVLREELHSY